MPYFRLALVPTLAAALMVGCSTTAGPETSERSTIPTSIESKSSVGSVQTVETMTVPDGVRGVMLLTQEVDPWLFTQQERSIVYLMGTASLYVPGPLAVTDQTPEFHVGNRFFFSEGLGLGEAQVDTVVARLADEHGEPPFVMTATHQVVVPGRTVIIPNDFEGRLIWMRPTGRNTAYTRQFTAEILQVRGIGNP